jgi:selenide, water dikinase
LAAATDVTGFGLLGHGLEMARGSGTGFVFESASLPVLEGALEVARHGVETGGAGHNRRFVAPASVVASDVPAELVSLAYDPQTSGGLLAAVSEERLEAVRAGLDAAGVEHWLVGRVEASGSPGVRLV